MQNRKLFFKFLFAFVLLLAAPFVLEQMNKSDMPFARAGKSKQSETDATVINFWQYWSGIEKEPLQKLVEKFNKEDHGFKVQMLSISLPRKKIQMAITGGVPPDLVHLDGDMVTDFALRSALVPLDEIASALPRNDTKVFRNDKAKVIASTAKQSLDLDRFIPVYVDMLNFGGHQWALALMPTCEALHINRNLLRELNVDKPHTLKDIVEIFDKSLEMASAAPRNDSVDDTSSSRAKRSDLIGWLPTWPPWTGRFIPVVFGGKWGHKNPDGSITITANSTANIQAWTWVQKNFASKIPPSKLAAFTEGFNAYQSPDNPFYAGKIALENNGVWEYNLAKKFAPYIDLEIIAFPSEIAAATPRNDNTEPHNDNDDRATHHNDVIASKAKQSATLVTVDALAIPRGAKHPELAYKFMHWLLQQKNLEELALAQQKFSPLKNVSEDFYTRHPNPYIKVFVDLANSPHATYFPQVSFVQRYRREIKEAYNRVVRQELSAQEALDQLQTKMEMLQ